MTHQSITPVTETAHLTKARLCHRRKSTGTVSNLLEADPQHTRNTFQLYLSVLVLVDTPFELSVLDVSGRKVLFIPEILCLMMQARPKSGKKN